MKKLLFSHSNRLLSYGIDLVVFLSAVFPFSDKDWGWHYRYGEYLISQKSLLREELFSWTLPNYQWVNHSWLYDPLLYILTRLTGLVGLSIVSALLTALTFAVLTRIFPLRYWQKALLAIPFFMLSEISISSGLRSQSIAFLFFALLISLLIRMRQNPRVRWLLPPLFLLWANMHGDFTLGLLVVGVFFGSYSLEDFFSGKLDFRYIVKHYALPLGATLLLTLVNPFTYHVYLETLHHAGNPYLRNVLEWDPLFDHCPECHPYSFLLYSVIVFGALILQLRFFSLPFALLFLGLFVPALQTRRLAPIFLIVTLPTLASYLSSRRWPLDAWRILPWICAVCLISVTQYNLFTRYTRATLYQYSEDSYCYFASGCSRQFVDYLMTHPPTGRGFTFYDWGGYLIYRRFPQKLFVDGRMHVWKQDGYQPFGDYIEMYYHDNFSLFLKYDFDWAVIPDSSTLAKKMKESSDVGRWKLEYQLGGSDYFVRLRE